MVTRALILATFLLVPSLLSAETWIKVNRKTFTLELVQGTETVKTYHIAVGRKTHPTQTGTFYIIEKQRHPTWYPHPLQRKEFKNLPTFQKYPNPLGACWMGFSRHPKDLGATYGIHGTMKPKSIGTAVTLGCIRMINRDVIDLFSKVRIGTRIFIE